MIPDWKVKDVPLGIASVSKVLEAEITVVSKTLGEVTLRSYQVLAPVMEIEDVAEFADR